MSRDSSQRLLCAAVLAAFLLPVAPALRGADDGKGKVAGIMIDKNDNWITVKADGEDDAVKYVLPKEPDKKLAEAYKHVFNACRVTLTYKKVGDERQLTGVQRQIFKKTGTITGQVVKVYNNFWVEVKPKSGPADAFAPGGDNYKNKGFMDRLTGLQPGDVVTIGYTTDSERHRIKLLRIDKKAK